VYYPNLVRTLHLFDQKYSKAVISNVITIQNKCILVYFIPMMAEVLASLLQSSVSHGPSEISIHDTVIMAA